MNALWPHEVVFSRMRTHLLGLFWPTLRSSHQKYCSGHLCGPYGWPVSC